MVDRVNFEAVWRIRSFFVTPRDQIVWLKLMHRNLYTADRDDNSDGLCKACARYRENQIYLAGCFVIVRSYWTPVIDLISALGGETPGPGQRTSYLTVGRVDDRTCVGQTAAGVLFLAWRALYAATVNSRVRNRPLNLNWALKYLGSMVVKRLTAYGEKWMTWSNTRTNTSLLSIIPQKFRERQVISQGPWGDYTIHEEIQKWIDRLP